MALALDDFREDTLIGGPVAGSGTDRLLGWKVGTIRIHKLLGEGGMGAVYAGFDERLRREVALKAVRSDALTSNGRSRLLSEARVLSRLNHPNICSIHDFVTGEETDFLVLELIRGKTLREAIQRGIDPAARLGVAERIADALVAAHAQGIIHRDLKSSNVMLTWDGGVKVLDFGIARLGEDAPAGAGLDPDHTTVFIPESEESFQFARTAPGKVVGTAGCMSPEQARDEEVSVASDMYSFGLLLQELFTGKPPYASGLNGIDLLKEVQKGRTLPVTGIDAHLADLIESLKSLAPESRPSASEALQRLLWIGDKPRRRNRMLAIGLAVLLAVAGVGKYTWDLRQERDAAVHAQRDAELSRRQGDEIAGFLTDLFKVSDPGEARGSTVTARELLDQGARRVRRDLREQPPVQARLLDTIGQVYLKLGLYAEARPLLEDALTIRRQPGGDPLDLSISLEHLALLDQAQSRPEAEALLRQAIRIRETALGSHHPQLAPSLTALADLCRDQKRYAEAEALYRRALAIYDAAYPPTRPERLALLKGYAQLLRATGKTEQAKAMEWEARTRT